MRKLPDKFCVDCNIKIDRRSIRCIHCARNIKNNHMSGLFGKKHPAYKNGGITYCIDCGKKIISSHPSKRCVKCGGIQRGLKLKGRKRPEHSKLMTGKGNPAYVDGNSYLPYTEDFTRQLKREIRERDNHECQLCNIIEEVLNQLLDVHHIDYNKENCSKQNLISLCRKCNIKVNLNRDFWFAYFTYIMENKC